MGERFESHVALLRKFISEQAEGCLKGPAHYLKYPFIDPGSVYSANLWDWDSFWSTYALLNLEGDLLPQGSVTPSISLIIRWMTDIFQ
ncbi:hypothetical protein [Paenibacillus anaericanus]|uniref:hypothetical protein n=1 Tax=Paenibacillus anaericanus TaxID=170367 RepID=UPI001B85E54B|nr:hypothetical protein [Paenibacillus anaericanus]